MKKTIFVVGALAAATFVSSAVAEASVYRHASHATLIRHASYRGADRTARWTRIRGVGRSRHDRRVSRLVAPVQATTTSQPHYAYLPSDAYTQVAGATNSAQAATSNAVAASVVRRSAVAPVLGTRAFAPQRMPSRSRVAAVPRPLAAPRLVPASTSGAVQVGSASYYSGRRTASGGTVGAATCAHRSLPFGTKVLVTNLKNEHQAVLTVNDRGPFVRGRIIDVSTGAASMLGMRQSGTAPVRIQVVGGPG